MIANQNALPNTIETVLRNLFAGAIAGGLHPVPKTPS
jgi:hypothetical protein